jgi:two-component sensor histidine kinase
VFQRTLRRSGSLEEFAAAFRGRLMALARAHEMVSAAGWNPVPLRELALKELNPYADGKARILLEGPAVAVTPRTALAMGMVLHELATNASKYGALSEPQGHVTFSGSVEGTGPRDLRLRWIEVGGPPVAEPKRRGFGSELIERQVRHDLHGTVSIDFAPAGLRAEIAFPLDRPLDGCTAGRLRRSSRGRRPAAAGRPGWRGRRHPAGRPARQASRRTRRGRSCRCWAADSPSPRLRPRRRRGRRHRGRR